MISERNIVRYSHIKHRFLPPQRALTVWCLQWRRGVFCEVDYEFFFLLLYGWIGLAQDRDRWRTLVSAVMNLGVP